MLLIRFLCLESRLRNAVMILKSENFRLNKNIGKNCFPNRIFDELNRFGSYIVFADIMDTLLNRLDKYMDM